jgi:hypothetical protein
LAQVEAESVQEVAPDGGANQPQPASTKVRSVAGLTAASMGGTGASISVLELYGNLALVEVRVSQPTEVWHKAPYRVARVVRKGVDGWQPIVPVNTFWRERGTVDTDYFRLDYSRRDEAVVLAVAPELDALYLRLHSDLGLPAPVRSQRTTLLIAVVEGSEVRVTSLRYSGNTLIIAPPDLILRPAQMSKVEALHQAIAFSLAVRTFDNAHDKLPVSCQWGALREGIGLWLRWEGHTLPSRRLWEYQSAIKQWSSPSSLPRLDDLLSVPVDCTKPAELLEVEVLNSGRPMPRNELAATLVGYLVSEYERQIIPALLRHMDESSSWNSLAEATVSLSAKELESDCQAYLVNRSP